MANISIDEENSQKINEIIKQKCPGGIMHCALGCVGNDFAEKAIVVMVNGRQITLWTPQIVERILKYLNYHIN